MEKSEQHILTGNKDSVSYINIYSAKTAEVCKILQVKIASSPKVIFFTMNNNAYLYEGELKASQLLINFISDDYSFQNHSLFAKDTAKTVQIGI